MTEFPIAAAVAEDGDRLVYTSRITDDNGVTDRALRSWVVKGKFPAPDGSLNGRKFWKLSTYRKWQADVMAGKYKQQRSFGQPSGSEQAA